MSKSAPKLSILTANRLGDGAVVFLDFEGAWNENIAEAIVAHSPDEVRALEDRGGYDAARNLVVEPYLVEIRKVDGRFEPSRYRERVRAAGPSMLGDVPGYVAPSVPSPRSSRGEGRPLALSQSAAAPHHDPLPIVKNDGERGLVAAEAA